MAHFPDLVQGVLRNSMRTFGTPFVLFPIDSDGKISGVGINQCGVFDDDVVEIDLDAADDFSITGHGPRMGINLCDFVNEPKKRDQIERDGQRYEIIDILQDGQGGAEFRLHELDPI